MGSFHSTVRQLFLLHRDISNISVQDNFLLAAHKLFARIFKYQFISFCLRDKKLSYWLDSNILAIRFAIVRMLESVTLKMVESTILL